MAGRPLKAGLDYFELDCHMEDKVRYIQAEFGLKGFAIVVKLYQKIYGELGYYCEWNEDSSLLFMSENGVSSRVERNLIGEIVSACIRRDIFSEQIYRKYGVLTSVGVQEHYLRATSKRDSVELKKEYLLVKVPEKRKNVVINSISGGINSISGDRNAQSREEKSREEYKPPLSPLRGKREEKKTYADLLPDNDALRKAFGDYVEMRKKLRKPMTDRAVELAVRKLEKLAPGPDGMDCETAVGILEQSVLQSWQGLFPLKEETTQRKQTQGKTKFSNYQERDYNYDELEKMLLGSAPPAQVLFSTLCVSDFS